MTSALSPEHGRPSPHPPAQEVIGGIRGTPPETPAKGGYSPFGLPQGWEQHHGFRPAASRQTGAALRVRDVVRVGGVGGGGDSQASTLGSRAQVQSSRRFPIMSGRMGTARLLIAAPLLLLIVASC